MNTCISLSYEYWTTIKLVSARSFVMYRQMAISSFFIRAIDLYKKKPFRLVSSLYVLFSMPLFLSHLFHTFTQFFLIFYLLTTTFIYNLAFLFTVCWALGRLQPFTAPPHYFYFYPPLTQKFIDCISQPFNNKFYSYRYQFLCSPYSGFYLQCTCSSGLWTRATRYELPTLDQFFEL